MNGDSPIDRFVPGQAYFIVVYNDESLSIPIIQTLIFVKRSVRDNGIKCLRFRELHAQGEETGFFVDEEHADHLVLDHVGLLKQLQASFDGRILHTPPKDL